MGSRCFGQVGDEIQGFKLDMSSPMTPFSITGFKSRGPAQEAGMFLDPMAMGFCMTSTIS